MQHRKLRVGIVYGGRSSEHEVSVASARSIMAAIDHDRYEVVPIAIDRDGHWLPGVEPKHLASPEDAAQGRTAEATLQNTSAGPLAGAIINRVNTGAGEVDIVFPVLHGTYGEDGALQGMLEMAGLPYVGCGILGSALGMDKEKAKQIFSIAGLPVVPWITVTRSQVDNALDATLVAIAERFEFPVFVKPANMGSSVGVGKAHDAIELRTALTAAARYDRKILIEPSVNCREIECAVLGNDDPEASVVGEIIPNNEFYDYQAKYLDGAAGLLIPAPIADELALDVRRMAVAAFRALDLSGLARVDFFLDRDTNAVYINEVNTLPGFTEISMYPKLWEATGLPYPTVIDRLIQFGLDRHAERQRNLTSVDYA